MPIDTFVKTDQVEALIFRIEVLGVPKYARVCTQSLGVTLAFSVVDVLGLGSHG
jgi:hypothetical protein